MGYFISLSNASPCGRALSQRSESKSHEVFCAVVTVLAFAACALVFAAAIAPGSALATNGLVSENGNLRYYKGDQLQTDKKAKVSGATYYFDKNGNAVRGKSVKINTAYWVFGDNGKLLTPSKKKYYKLSGGMYYVGPKGHPAKTGYLIEKGKLRYIEKNGKVKTSGTVQGIKFKADGYAVRNLASKLKITVMKRVAKITKPSWSKSRKLRACWRWALGHGTFVNSSAIQSLDKPAWVQRQAYKTMNSNKNECFGTACSFAMMAFELGYTPIVHGAKHVHAFVYINGKRYDNMRRHLTNMYKEHVFKVTSWAGTAQDKPARKKVSGVKVPKGGTGWVKKSGSWYYFRKSKMLKNTWFERKGKTYFLTGSGKAAVGSVKVKTSNKSSKKAYFVFSKRGVLQAGRKTRIVTVAKTAYRVNAKGRALQGWGSGKKSYFYQDGRRAQGDVIIGSKLYAFSAKGVFNAARTDKLRKAAKVGADASALVKLLGTPTKTTVDKNSCRTSFASVDGTLAGYGVEKVLAYPHIKVYTYTAPKGSKEYLSFYEAA